jgi:hypothetical protein
MHAKKTNKEQRVQVSDTTGADNSTIAHPIKILKPLILFPFIVRFSL